MGSLCCVAARSHGSNTASRDWSVGPREPFWRTNSSFSPPPPRWDSRFQSEGSQYGLQDGVPLYGSSTSTNSKDRRSWTRGNTLFSNQYPASDGPGLLLSTPSDLSQGPQWTPPAIQEIDADEYGITARQDPGLGPFSSRPKIEGTSENLESEGVSSSNSEISESEPTVKLKSSSYRSIAGRRSFMSKPIHPLSIPTFGPVGEFFDSSLAEFPVLDSTTSQRDMHRWSSASSSIDFAENSQPFELENFPRPSSGSDGVRCGLCERFLSQRSPWSSRRIVRSGDMPVAGILSCHHVFHAECLEQTTPKTRKNDPPCPLCVKNDDHSPEQKTNLRLKSALTRLRPFSEDVPSKPWGCTHVGDCVEGALQAPPRSTTLLLNRNRERKSFSLKGSKGFPGTFRKSGSNLSHPFSSKSFDHGMVGCSKISSIDSSLKR